MAGAAKQQWPISTVQSLGKLVLICVTRSHHFAPLAHHNILQWRSFTSHSQSMTSPDFLLNLLDSELQLHVETLGAAQACAQTHESPTESNHCHTFSIVWAVMTIMMPWCHDAMMPWCHDAMMPWCHDVIMSWCHDVIMSWCHDVMMSWDAMTTIIECLTDKVTLLLFLGWAEEKYG